MVRINKFLADAGIASRRAADELIARGVVTIDGRRAVAGDRVDPSVADVRVDGRAVRPQRDDHAVIALNKPSGVVTTMSDERGRPCVADLLPSGRRLFPIGRLDAQTTGLLLCTSDGELARALSHPSFGVERRYRVVVNATPTAEALRELGASDVVRRADGAAFDVVLRGGKNREIRRSCARLGLRVLALERVAYGPVKLGDLRPSRHRSLTAAETGALRAFVDRSKQLDRATASKRGRVRPTE